VTTSRDKTLEPETREALDVESLAPAVETEVSDDPRERAVQEFHARHRGLKLAPVVVVIPAFNEEDAIRPVLDDVPREACGLAVDTIVIDDGSSDGTADAACAAGRGLVASCPVNRGQGRALRLGYRIAREHGAAYVVTTDADGQYSPDEIAVLTDWFTRTTGLAQAYIDELRERDKA